MVYAMSKQRIAIIGLGHLGSRHLKVLHEMSGSWPIELTAVCDINPSSARPLAEQYGVPFVEDYRRLPSPVDAVTICVPTQDHFDIARFFLEQGIHTFIEKPITSTLQQADTLLRLAGQTNAILQVGHVERFNAGFQSILRFTRQPLFIECHRLNLFPNRSLDIGVVMDLMIHDIDIVLGLVRSEVKDIQAVGVNVLTPLEDIASVRITFQNRCVCNLTASRISDEVMRKIRLFQKDTYISLDYVKQEAFIYKKYERQILKHALPIEREEPLRKELEHFVHCVQTGQKPLVGGTEARQALAVALDITRKIWNR